MIARRILVSGRVQGVAFRGWTVETAGALGSAGWVRNLRSGEVEIYAVGETEVIEALIDRCWSGPMAARVDDVQVEEAEVEPLEGFTQRPTA